MGMIYGGQDYIFSKNLQGDVIGIYNPSRQLVAKYTYNAYGEITAITNASGTDISNNATHIANINPFRYRGYYYDTETGFYYLQTRYYDPIVGRFINRDTSDILTATPTALTDKNLFAYCDNNPIIRVDKGGQFWDIVFDVGSFFSSIYDVCTNPSDPWAWAGLAGDAVDLIPFVTGVGETVKAVSAANKVVNTVDTVHDVGKTVDKVEDVVDATHAIAKTSNRIENTVDKSANSIRYTDKVLKQMDNTADINHSFPYFVDTFVDFNSGRPLIGGDGVARNFIELPGNINGIPGVFEYIIEPNGLCNHRYFRNLR